MISRIRFLVLAMALCLGLGVTGWAQQGWYHSDDGGRGFYGQDGDHDRDDGYYRDHDGGRDDSGHRRWQNQARRFGYIDGVRDGQNDGREGHTYRPEHDGDYKHADRGYSSAFGDKELYRQEYRQAFLEGYRSAYRRY